MKTDQSEERDASISEDVARSTLDNLLADARFRVTERGKSILKYIAAHYFSGSLDGIKGYSIAIDVLGRPSNFDPSIDPIVRIELSRLRTALFQYYEAYGHELDMSVDIPKGKYTINFSPRDTPLRINGKQFRTDIPEMPGYPVISDKNRSKFNSNIAVSLAAVLAAALVFANLFSAPSGTTKPVISINMQATDDRLRGEASQVRDALLTALTQFTTLSIQASNVRRDHAQTLNYEIDMKYYQDEDTKSVWWSIKDVGTSEILQSGIDSASAQTQSMASIREALIPVLAAQFAASRSAINVTELKKSNPNDLGNVCILRAELISENMFPETIQDVRNCLELTLRNNPNDGDANAALAQALVFPINGRSDQASIERSQELARRAIAISPMSDRSQTAMMLSQFYSGKVSAAIETGHKAIAINPNNPTTLGLVAWFLFTTGNWEKSLEIAKAGGRVPSMTPTSVQLIDAFDAYRRGDWSRAANLAEQNNSGGDLLTALRIASLGQLGSPEAKIQLNDVQSEDPEFIDLIDTRLAYERMAIPLRLKLLQGLRKASASGSTLISSGAI